ncbi:hypothetical protein [Streptomyces sp. NPDC051569]|uniref:hypothetical protein n=1 Tax=Streptomyces sp. NPDC051569 TaxID=3365661 RepID=UPI0037ADB3F6
MDQMKAMVVGANPGEVHNVATGWGDVNTKLVGEGGGGGVRQAFLAAVDEVLEHWEGDAADAFRARAQVIGVKIQDGAKYAEYTSTAMRSAATVLETIKPEVEAMEKPGTLDSWGDTISDGLSRDDAGLKADQSKGMSTQDALDRNKDDLSAGKEAQLRMAVKMEQLGAAYASQAKAMGSWRKGGSLKDDDDYPGDPGGIAPVPIVAVPTEGGPRLVGRAPAGGGVAGGGTGGSAVAPSPNSPRLGGGIGGGSPSRGSSPSGVGTDVDGIVSAGPRGGGAGVGPGGGAAGSAGVIGGGPGSTAGAGAGLGAGGFPGVPGVGAGVGRGGSVVGGSAGTGAGAGRPGMGAGGGAGAGAGRAGAAGGRGPLARAKGGTVGAAGGRPSPAGGAGSGLHGSRGGSAEGRKTSGTSNGAHGPGATGKGRDKDKNGKQRPDYLVEDEETWVTQQNVTPRTIE